MGFGRNHLEQLLYTDDIYLFSIISDIDPVYQRQDIEKQLDFIKDEVELLYEVNKECTKLMKEKKLGKSANQGKSKDK